MLSFFVMGNNHPFSEDNHLSEPLDKAVAKNTRQKFFLEFSASHSEWLRELVSKYKERGEYPIIPTQIIEYYPEKSDKEIAIFSAFCMNWENGNELEQIASLRRIMGAHPAKWFADREYTSLSIGREMNNTIDGYAEGRYWKIAKVFDMLFELSFDGRGVRYPSDVFKKESFEEFCDEISSFCKIKDMEYKRGVVEVILRSSDGLGRNLWPTVPRNIKCPRSDALSVYMRTWFPYWRSRMWTWDEAIGLFGLEHDYDFFYAFLAHKELEKRNPEGCKKYLQRYQSRWKQQQLFSRKYWLGSQRIAPEINF